MAERSIYSRLHDAEFSLGTRPLRTGLRETIIKGPDETIDAAETRLKRERGKRPVRVNSLPIDIIPQPTTIVSSSDLAQQLLFQFYYLIYYMRNIRK